MYKEWIEKSVYVSLHYGRLLVQLNEIERKVAILESMASELIDYGMFNFHQQNEFPMGRSHFNHFLCVLSKIADMKIENDLHDFFLINREKISEMMKNDKRNFEFGRVEE